MHAYSLTCLFMLLPFSPLPSDLTKLLTTHDTLCRSSNWEIRKSKKGQNIDWSTSGKKQRRKGRRKNAFLIWGDLEISDRATPRKQIEMTFPELWLNQSFIYCRVCARFSVSQLVCLTTELKFSIRFINLVVFNAGFVDIGILSSSSFWTLVLTGGERVGWDGNELKIN